jgi:hypothetical protein
MKDEGKAVEASTSSFILPPSSFILPVPRPRFCPLRLGFVRKIKRADSYFWI